MVKDQTTLFPHLQSKNKAHTVCVKESGKSL